MKIFAAIILALSCLVADAANVRLYFQSNTNASVLDTNYLIATPISSNIRADGGVVARGVPVRILNPSGVVTQSFNLGWYAVSNRALARGIVINVHDSSSTLYDLTNVLESGYNTYVKTVYGTNPPPTYDELTNAFGYVPLSPASGTNAWTAADTVVSNALSARLIATNDILYSLINAATNAGITAAMATNISANQALIVSNGLVPFVASRASTNAPVIRNPEFVNRLSIQSAGLTGLYITNSAEAAVEFRGTDDDAPWLTFNTAEGITLLTGKFTGDGGGLTKTPTATNAQNSVNATNIYGAGLVSMTNAAVTWANTASNALSIRLINTNNSLITQFGAADTVVSNGAVSTAFTRSTLVSNGLTSAYIAADTVVSNGAVAYATAATNFALRYIAQGTNIVLLTNGNTITVHSTATGSGGSGSGIPTASGSGTNTTLVFTNANWGDRGRNEGTNSVILSGRLNTIIGTNRDVSILTGVSNWIGSYAYHSIIVGGVSNRIDLDDNYSVIGGGFGNVSGSGIGNVIAGGYSNEIQTVAQPYWSAIGGGIFNTIRGNYSAIAGGQTNFIIGDGSSILGGASNSINGHFSIAAGRQAQVTNDGVFLWSDNTGGAFRSTASNQFLIRATSGVGINTNNPSGQALKVIGTTASDNYTIKDLSLLTATTNVIRVAGAGSASANGTYTWAGAAHYTNSASTELRLTNNTAGNWQLKSNTVVLYSSTAQVAATWILQSGSLAVPTSVYGAYENMDGLRILGHVSSTNLDSRFTVSAAAVATNDSRTFNLTNASIGGVAAYATTATNLLSTYYWATNALEDKTRIFVTGTVTPSAARGEYRVVWTNSTGLMGVWTNVADPTFYIMLNRDWDTVTNYTSFLLTRGTNSADALASYTQLSEHPSSLGAVTFWENPHETDVYSTGFYNGSATLTWGTNQGTAAYVNQVGTGSNSFALPYYSGTIRYVATNGNDTLPQRTNNFPYATLGAANEASSWGDVIEVLPGHHRTFGIHMNRGVTIRGHGERTIIEPLPDPDYNHETFFQSPLISIWDGGVVENLVITNGGIGFTQHEGDWLGGTNSILRNVTIYPGYLPAAYPQILQASYFGYGVKFSRLGNNILCENVRIFTSAIGFDFQSSVDSGHTNQSQFTLKNCEVIASPEYMGTNNYWFGKNMLGFGVNSDAGGMIPIAFSCGDTGQAFNYGGVTLNIEGGVFQSINGATNSAEYVGGETNTSRNCGIWIARGHTNQIRINFSGLPEFRLANTNTYTNFILDETTNSRVAFSGAAVFKYLPNGDRNAVGTNTLQSFNSQLNGDGGGLTNLISYQVVYAAGSPATSSSSQEVLNFGTTDPSLTVSQAGIYEVKAMLLGITSSADSGNSITIGLCTNNVFVTQSTVIYPGQDVALSGSVFPFGATLQPAYLSLAAGDVVSLQWDGAATDYQAQYAAVSIIKLK